jgi:hypothetical protein
VRRLSTPASKLAGDPAFGRDDDSSGWAVKERITENTEKKRENVEVFVR